MNAKDKACQTERFNQLLRVLYGVQKRQKESGETLFDLYLWACGSTACAIGHAASDPWFIDQGLAMMVVKNFDLMSPTYCKASGWTAVERFFFLHYNHAQFLFSESEYPSNERDIRHVIQRIREYCESHNIAISTQLPVVPCIAYIVGLRFPYSRAVVSDNSQEYFLDEIRIIEGKWPARNYFIALQERAAWIIATDGLEPTVFMTPVTL